MIVRILNDNRHHIGFYDKIYANRLDRMEMVDKLFKVTHWLILSVDIASILRQEMKKESLDLKHSDDAYGVYEMTEEEIALWLLKI